MTPSTTPTLTTITALATALLSASLSLAAEPDSIPDWRARLELARTLSYAKKLDESVAEYQKVLKEKPDLSEAKAELATVLFWQGKQKESLLLIEQLDKPSLTPEARLAAADMYAARTNYPKAEALYLEHLSTKPDDHATRVKLADVLSWEKKFDAAIKEYETVLRALPQDQQVIRKYGMVLGWAGRHAEAAEQLRKTLK